MNNLPLTLRTTIQIQQGKDGKCHVRNQTAALEIIKRIKSEQYLMVLGARHNQKSLLLADVKAQLQQKGEWKCIYVDLIGLKDVDESDFIHEFAKRFAQETQSERIDIKDPQSPSAVNAKPSSLQTFLKDYARLVPNLVLLLDHLERIEIEPLKTLLQVLMSLKTRSRFAQKLRVIATSSSALDLGVNRPSIVDLAHPVWVQDMTPAESAALIRFALRQKGVKITRGAERRFFDATQGDRYLLPILADHCAAFAVKRNRKEVTEDDAQARVDWFVNKWAKSFPALRGNVRAVARDTVALMNVLKVLAKGIADEKELLLDHKVDLYNFRLTGVIAAKRKGSKIQYAIKNEFYERYLSDHFRPEHVPHILSMSGGWQHTRGYLRRLVADFPRYRATLLGKVVDFIRTAEDEPQACNYLIRQAAEIFGLARAKVYTVNPVRSHLEQKAEIGFEGKKKHLRLREATTPESAPMRGFSEVDAYRSRDFIVKTKGLNKSTVFVPLLRNDGRSLGVVAIYNFEGDIHGESFLELLEYFKRAGRAVGAVIDRARESLQLRMLNKTSQDVINYLDKQKVAKATVDAAIKAVPGAQRGVLFLWNEEKQRLFIEAFARRQLFETNPAKEIILQKGEGYAGSVFANDQPLRIGIVSQYPSLRYRDHPDIKKQKSVLCVPLKAWGRIMGVLFVDNISASYAFSSNDEQLLSTFAAQAAIALQNTQFYSELYKLGLTINTGVVDIPEIFVKTVQSITQVTAAKGAHMLLLQDVDDPMISPADKVVLSKSVGKSMGLGDDYDREIRPRSDGLAFRVLRDRKFHAVPNSDVAPGINALAYKHGTRAYICLPMEGPTSVIGVLFVYYMEEHGFTGNEIEMLSVFSNQAALAIENTRQREKLEIMEGVTWRGLQLADKNHSALNQLRPMQMATNTLKEISTGRNALDQMKELQRYIKDVEETLSPVRPLQFRPTPTKIELNDLLRRVIDEWCPIDEQILTDFNHLKRDKIWIIADRARLSAVVKILTQNAVKAMRYASLKRLTASSAVEKGIAVVTIKNTGAEIPLEIKSQLLKEPITKNSAVNGSGMGLLIARSILLRLGGDIRLVKSDSTETTFSFFLPLATQRRRKAREARK